MNSNDFTIMKNCPENWKNEKKKKKQKKEPLLGKPSDEVSPLLSCLRYRPQFQKIQFNEPSTLSPNDKLYISYNSDYF